MFQAIRNRLSATGVLAVIALVFALTGGAYAASRVIIKNLNQISPSVQKKLRGQTGARGPAGAAGATGPAGAPGSGTPGAEGKQGVPGEKGEKGAEGSPWTAGGTLPSKATETGTWAGQAHTNVVEKGPPEASSALAPISFSIPLKAELSETHVHFIAPGGTGGKAECEEGTVKTPKAAPGNLCVYAGEVTGELHVVGIIKPLTAAIEPGAATTGAVVLATPENEEQPTGAMVGTWAVTAP